MATVVGFCWSLPSVYRMATTKNFKRNPTQQLQHDEVIERLADALEHKKPFGNATVHTNPGSEKNCSIEGLWPDVVLTRGKKDVPAIFEVETEDSVTEGEATRQWAPYANLGPLFVLVVPAQAERKARKLLEEHEIDATLWTYHASNKGSLTFSTQPA